LEPATLAENPDPELTTMADQTDNRSNSPPRLSVPAELQAFSEPYDLLPGESPSDYEAVRQMMVDDVQPETNLEWLWTLDLIELSWEILRYRCLKRRVLEEHRHSAIRAILLRLDGERTPTEKFQHLQLQVGRVAAEWRDDPNAAVEIEARLRQHGFDDIVVNAEVFYQARGSFAMFDDLTQTAQNRRMVLFREISIRREFARRAKSSSDAVVDGKLVRISKAGVPR
jgi:hypothetical protein